MRSSVSPSASSAVSSAFDAALRQIAAHLEVGRLDEALAEVVVLVRGTLGASGASLVAFNPDEPPLVDGDASAEALALLAARVQRSAAPEASSDGFAVPVEGLVQPWGVLAVLAPRSGSTDAEALVQALRAAALAGRCIVHRQAVGVLAEHDARARAVLETTVDGIVTIDSVGTILSFNQAAERLFAMTAAEALGQNVSALMPEPDRSRHDGYLRRYLETGEARIVGIGREVVAQRADGTTFPMELAVSEVMVGDRRLFTGLIHDVSERRALEQEVLRVSDDERRRIGQDLHDGLGQMLSGIALIASGLARKLKTTAPDVAAEVEEVAQLVREADTYARTLARNLVPVELAQGGLRGAVERLAESAGRLYDLDVALDLDGPLDTTPSDVALHFYRIAQEALANAARHGRARHVAVTLHRTERTVRLTVTDDGVGFDPKASDRAGLGLRTMRHRARLVGASFGVESAPGHGTTVSAEVVRAADSPPPGAPVATS